jgi:predicted DNA repair protein MutK
LIVGGAFLCYEGAEKVYEAFAGHHEEVVEPSERGPDSRRRCSAAPSAPT